MKPLRRLTTRLLAIAAVAVILAVATVGWLGSSHLLIPPRRVLQDYHKEILSNPSEFGLSIDHWAAPSDTPALIATPASQPGSAWKSRELRHLVKDVPPWGEVVGTVIMLHGHQGRKEDMLPICERFCAAGLRCVTIDLPGHGENPEPLATFGHREADLVGKLREAFPDDHPCFLFGVSQGGAIALQAAAVDSTKWHGVISVAAFATLEETLISSARDLHPVARPLSPLLAASVSAATHLRAGFHPSSIRPIDASHSLELPVLLIHGDADRFIPPDHARRLYHSVASDDKDLLIIAGADHGRVLAADAANTYAACSRFMLGATR